MLAYEVAHAMALALIERGRIPVVECTYSRRWQRESLARILQALPSTTAVHVVECVVSVEEGVRRFRASAEHQATDLTEQLVRERATDYPYTREALQLRSDTGEPEQLAQVAQSWLSAQPIPVNVESWVAAGKP
ncbi:hypothetical protein BKA23_2762 [Rudaeicoccus suwonensis]|uniref:AAA domain-containing protein n=2 Tax=Rudaeicoccus suwonensis TaxID=657409 RepID=A0A561E469_9MICO|nr:hypothetical protein BKA23_2762 [Rudaeicoccus suwonensis]